MNRQGFATVFIVSFIPVIILLLCAVVGASLVLLQWRHSHEFCQTSLLEVQNISAKQINKLFALNPRATALRMERAIAEANLLASPSGGPPAVAAAKAYLDSVVIRQALLRAQQERIKGQALLMPNLKLVEVQQKFVRMTAIEMPTTTNAHLNVRPTPANSESPDYLPLESFSKRQVIRGSWTISPSKLLPEWLRRHLPRLAKLKGKCAATLAEKGTLWNPILGEGKSYWNY